MKKTLKLLLKQLPLILFVLVILFSVYTAHHFAYNINDSDFASELVLGNFLAEQNKLVSTDWFYGSELRILSTNLVYMPLFKIFHDFPTVYFLGALVIQLFLVLSYYYLSQQIGLKRNAFLLSAALLLLPVCIYYGRNGLYQTYYAPCFIIGFLIAGLYLSAIRHKRQGKPLAQSLRLLALFTLAAGGSLNGARQIPGTILPLLATAFAVSVLSRPKDTPLKDVLGRGRFELGLAAAVFLLAGFGFFIHNAVLSRYFVFGTATDGSAVISSVDRLRSILVGYLTLFGFQEKRLLFSAEGLLALGSVFAAAVFLCLSIRSLLARKGELAPPAAFLKTFYPVAMLLMTGIFCVTDRFVNYHVYYLSAFVWIFPFIGLLLNESPDSLRQITLEQALVYLVCLILFANGIYNNLYYLHPDDKQVEYDYLTQIDIDSLQRFDGVLTFIEENGYEVGYATHWQANIVTAATNGRIPIIRIIRVYPYPIFAYDDVLTYKQSRELSFVEDKEVFLLLTRDEGDIFSGSDLAPFAIPVYEDEYYRIYTFDFSTEVWDYLLDQAEYLNQTTVLDQLLPDGQGD